MHILPIIPPRSNRKMPDHPDYHRYRDGNRIERMFGLLKRQRRITIRYDKTALSFLGFLNIAAARLWLKAFVNMSYGSIISVGLGPVEWCTALTGDAIDELRSMIADARRSPDEWDQFLQDFVSDPATIEMVKAHKLR